jgi:hypothetical protein
VIGARVDKCKYWGDHIMFRETRGLHQGKDSCRNDYTVFITHTFMNDTDGALDKKIGLLPINFTIPLTQLPSVSSVFFIPTHYMFQPYFWVNFKWYTYLNINHLNHHAIHSIRTWVPCS